MTTRVRTRRQAWFRVAALAALAEAPSVREATELISAMAERVSRQPVNDFVRDDMPQLAAQTLLLLNPSATPLHVELLLFHRNTAGALFLIHELSRRRFVARVDELSGAYNVAAEVVTPTRNEASLIAEEFDADERLLLAVRRNRTGTALAEAARAVYASAHH